jgi:O-antigen/teichoic acid export membrane protein
VPEDPGYAAAIARLGNEASQKNSHLMAKKDRRSHFARNVVANWIAFLFAAVVGFFMSPYVVEHLGATRYGVWSLLAGMIGYLALLDLGIRQAVNRYVAHHRAVGAHDESSSIVSAALRLFGIPFR